MAQTYDSNRNPAQAKNRWFAVDRDIFDHELVGADAKVPEPVDPKRAAWAPMIAWQWMIREASYADRQVVIAGNLITLRRGQFAHAMRYMARRFNWGHKAMRNFLGRLELAGMISRDIPEHGEAQRKGQKELDLDGPKKGTPLTVVTLCNYDRFQIAPDARGTPGAHQGHRVIQGTPTREDSSRSVGESDSSSRAESELRTDDELGERLPFTEQALSTCEKMGFTRKTLVDRYRQKTARRATPIRDPSAYLITMAIDMAAKARGVPAQALRASLGRSPEEAGAGHARASGALPQPSETMLRNVTLRCERRGLMVTALIAAWHQRVKGVHVLDPDRNFSDFAMWWLSQQRAA
jgi:hypothetical protein